MTYESDVIASLIRLKSAFLTAALEVSAKRFAGALKYSSDQPRVPSGSPEGGQWTGGEPEADSEEIARSPRSLEKIAGEPVKILEFAKRMVVAGRSLTYQQCMDICYPILERYKSIRWSDVNYTAFLRCMAACQKRTS